MGYHGLSTFDEVAKRYADTKPIKGARLAQDLRPLGERRYWWNRIMKVNDNKYLMLDGHWTGSWNAPAFNPETQSQTCPILWERKDDGDYITIRSHMNDGISVSRYTFLDRFLPRGLRFDWYTETGKHYVLQAITDETGRPSEVRHYLPKFKGKMDWQNSTFEMTRDSKIVFKVETDAQGKTTYTRTNEMQPYQTRRIDKELDRKYASKVTELWQWAKDMLPVLGTTITGNRYEYAQKLTDGGSYWYWEKNIGQQALCEILDDPEHEKRLALAVCVANNAGAVDNEGRFEEKADSLYQAKQSIRKAGKFYVIENR